VVRVKEIGETEEDVARARIKPTRDLFIVGVTYCAHEFEAHGRTNGEGG
jgi:hypothetical protein